MICLNFNRMLSVRVSTNLCWNKYVALTAVRASRMLYLFRQMQIKFLFIGMSWRLCEWLFLSFGSLHISCQPQEGGVVLQILTIAWGRGGLYSIYVSCWWCWYWWWCWWWCRYWIVQMIHLFHFHWRILFQFLVLICFPHFSSHLLPGQQNHYQKTCWWSW